MKKIIFGMVASAAIAGLAGFKTTKTAQKSNDKLVPVVLKATSAAIVPDFATRCQNSIYFERFGKKMGANGGTTNGVNLVQVLLGYYDTFFNDDFVPEEYDKQSTEYVTSSNPSITHFSVSPGNDDYENGVTAYYDYLTNICNTELKFNPANGTDISKEKKLLNRMMNRGGVANVNFNIVTGTFSEKLASSAETLITNELFAGNPVLVNWNSKIMIAFAFTNQPNSKYVWGFTGKAGDQIIQVPISELHTSNPWKPAVGACAVSSLYTYHKHSDNYFDWNHGLYVCGCGHTEYRSWVDNIDISNTYSNDLVYSRYGAHKLWIDCKYKRTARVNSMTYTMSPIRSGAGEAYIEFLGDKDCYGFECDLIYNSSSDYARRGDLTGEFWALERRSNGWYWIDCQTINMSSFGYRNGEQLHFSRRYDADNIIGFRLIIKGPATGNTDAGVVKITNTRIAHGASMSSL